HRDRLTGGDLLDQPLVALDVGGGLAVDGDDHVPSFERALGRAVLLDPRDHHHVAVLDAQCVQGDGHGPLLGGAHRGGVGQGGLLPGPVLGEDRLTLQHHLGGIEPGATTSTGVTRYPGPPSTETVVIISSPSVGWVCAPSMTRISSSSYWPST